MSERERVAHGIPRRTVLRFALGGAAGTLLAACGRGSDDSDGSTPIPSPSPAPGVDWPQPPELRSADGVLTATLAVAPAIVPYGAGERWALTVNGTSPGPTLRVRPGDRLDLVLENRLSHSTNLHTHGLHVSPAGNSDNPFIEVRPGEKFRYEINVPHDHPGGLFWYHPHFHHQVAPQVFGGYFGAIIVEDEFDRLPAVAAARERLVIVHDAKPGASESAVTGATMFEEMAGREGPVVLVNGQRMPVITASPGVFERWRILNASASRFYRLELPGTHFTVAGVDGGRLPAAFRTDALTLVPGERLEVFIEPGEAGTVALATAAVDRGTVGMGMGGRAVSAATDVLEVTVEPGAGAGAAPPPGPGIEDLGSVAVDRARDVTLSMQGMAVLIDGRAFDPARVDISARLGSVEEWTVRNTSSMDHPFHLHIWPFQVMEQSAGAPAPGWKDVVNVPAGGWVRLRVRFADFSGKSVYHCHILDHEDMGMMGTIEVA